jgi:hypothetical protein
MSIVRDFVLEKPLWRYLGKRQEIADVTSCNRSDLELYSRLLYFCNDENVLLLIDEQ